MVHHVYFVYGSPYKQLTWSIYIYFIYGLYAVKPKCCQICRLLTDGWMAQRNKNIEVNSLKGKKSGFTPPYSDKFDINVFNPV